MQLWYELTDKTAKNRLDFNFIYLKNKKEKENENRNKNILNYENNVICNCTKSNCLKKYCWTNLLKKNIKRKYNK